MIRQKSQPPHLDYLVHTEASTRPIKIVVSPHTQAELEHAIGRDHLSEWHEENIVWPGFTLLLATVVYTIVVNADASLPDPRMRIAGELVGAGGMLLAVIMLASTDSRLDEWKQLASAYKDGTAESAEIFKNVQRVAKRLRHIQIASAIAALGLAALHVKIEHRVEPYDACVLTIACLMANICYVWAIRNYCCERLRQVKLYLIDIHVACFCELLQHQSPDSASGVARSNDKAST